MKFRCGRIVLTDVYILSEIAAIGFYKQNIFKKVKLSFKIANIS